MYIEFDLPEIPEHAAGFPQYWLKSIFIQSPSNRYQINALTSTYVRLVETALVEYHSGTVKLREFWGTHSSLNLGAMHRSMSHFETCISNMYRATNCFRRLRRDRQQDPLSQELNVEKASFATDLVAARFRTIRNEIHHLEEMVMDGRIADGQPFALKADGPEVPHPTEPNQTIKTIDRLVIGTREMRFAELATLLKEMASVAVRIAEFRPNSSSGTHGRGAA
ncbi:hypothetical protein [Sulfurimicrobium lacus]|nr:hypothetical protein [Sulfurimicrobium lacus]